MFKKEKIIKYIKWSTAIVFTTVALGEIVFGIHKADKTLKNITTTLPESNGVLDETVNTMYGANDSEQIQKIIKKKETAVDVYNKAVPDINSKYASMHLKDILLNESTHVINYNGTQREIQADFGEYYVKTTEDAVELLNTYRTFFNIPNNIELHCDEMEKAGPSYYEYIIIPYYKNKPICGKNHIYIYTDENFKIHEIHVDRIIREGEIHNFETKDLTHIIVYGPDECIKNENQAEQTINNVKGILDINNNITIKCVDVSNNNSMYSATRYKLYAYCEQYKIYNTYIILDQEEGCTGYSIYFSSRIEEQGIPDLSDVVKKYDAKNQFILIEKNEIDNNVKKYMTSHVDYTPSSIRRIETLVGYDSMYGVYDVGDSYTCLVDLSTNEPISYTDHMIDRGGF